MRGKKENNRETRKLNLKENQRLSLIKSASNTYNSSIYEITFHD